MVYLFLFLAALLAGPSSAQPPTQVTLAYSPISTSPSSRNAQPIPFSTLSYHADNTSYTLSSFNAPKLAKDDAESLVRVGIIPYAGRQKRDGFAGPSITIAAASVLAAPESMVIRVALDSGLSVLSVGVSRDSIVGLESGKARDGKNQQSGWPRLEITYPAPEPRPLLNRPVVLNEEGKLPAQDKAEPTLFQKYWWVGALVLLFTVMGGGGGEEGGK